MAWGIGGTRRWALGLATAVALVLAMTGSAVATVSVAGTEPSYTKGTSNTWWFTYNSPSSTYYVCWTGFENGARADGPDDQNGHIPAAGSHDCSANLGQGSGGYHVTYPNLTEGHSYDVIMSEYYDHGVGCCTGGSFSAPNQTIMDNGAPSANTSVDGGNVTFTNNPILAVHIAYSDALSPPFPTSVGGATFDCLQIGSPCQPAVSSSSFDPACSHGASRSTSTTMDCTVDVTKVSGFGQDGKYFYCAREADSAIPDNPTGANQFDPAYADATHANTSTVNTSTGAGGCGSVTLDRTAPAVTATASATSVHAGDLVTLNATSTDGGSGPTGTYSWDYGDNTTKGSGASTTHTFTQPGTYHVTAGTTDRAGNAGSAGLTITVTARPGSSSTTTTPGPTTTTPGGATTPPSGPGTTVGPSAPTVKLIGSQGGSGGGAQQTVLGGLDLTAPRKLLTTARLLLVAATTDRPGRLDLALVRDGKIIGRGNAHYGRPGTYSLRVKLGRLKRGGYSLKASFLPDGATIAARKTLNIQAVKPKPKKKKRKRRKR
ncbi:MAG TPA: PKD domain-containing protein [Solirubrobacteraceae bacterium]|jgi:plastocyanin|nr:PKD domain-containing protein [Solirubrobacteraceae bacterium]